MFDRHLSTLNALPNLVGYIDRELRFRFVNEAHRNLFGDISAMLGRSIWDFIDPAIRPAFEHCVTQALGGQPVVHEFEAAATRGGAPRSYHVSYTPDRAPDGEVIGVVTIGIDQTERRRAEIELRNSQRTFDGAFRNAVIGKAIVNLGGTCVRVNDAFAKLLGYSPEELAGMNFRSITHPADLKADLELFQNMMAGNGDGYQVEKRYLHRDGTSVHALLSVSAVKDDKGQPIHFVSEVVDLTGQKLQQAKAHEQARTDPVTSLLNRRGFDEALRSLASGAAEGASLGVLMIDLDWFKRVNDQLGHAAGDAVLAEAGRRISESVRSNDEVGRLGGDEFGVLLIGTDRQQAALAANRVVTALNKPFSVGASIIRIGASVGAAVWDKSVISAEDLMRQADARLYQAKEAGRGQWRLAGVAGA